MLVKVNNKKTNKYMSVLEKYNLISKNFIKETRINDETYKAMRTTRDFICKKRGDILIARSRIIETYIQIDSFDTISKLDKELRDSFDSYKGLFFRNDRRGKMCLKIIDNDFLV